MTAAQLDGNFQAVASNTATLDTSFTLNYDAGLGFSASYTLDFGQVPYPVPLTPKEPLGSLIYDPSISGTIDPTGDTGWQTHSADLSAHTGSTVRLRFREEIPNVFTGPAQIEFDAISLELGLPGAPTNVDNVIRNFVAPTTDTYFARVSGAEGTDYSLLVTRNADFSIEDNDDIASAQGWRARRRPGGSGSSGRLPVPQQAPCMEAAAPVTCSPST